MANNGASPNADVLQHSVTRNDYENSPNNPMAIWHISIPGIVGGISSLPPYWSPLRDRTLRASVHLESMWASAVEIAITKISTKDWRIEGRRIQYWHELLLAADNNQTFVSFQEKLARDYLLTDNGCFIEIVRVANARGARVIGLVPLDSRRCWRTPDADIPIIYRDRKGIWHEMKDYQVLMLSDQPDQEYYGVGHCAGDRAYAKVLELAALELYTYEKVSGKRPHRIYFVNASLNETQLSNAMKVDEARSIEKGYVVYQDAVIIPILDPSAVASVAHIDLAGLPEGYDPDKERASGYKVYAATLGYSGNTIDPTITALSRNSLGTGSQSQTLDDLEQEHGAITSYLKKFSALLDQNILPPRVSYAWSGTDLRDEERRATIFKTNSQAAGELVDKGIVTADQAKNVLVDRGELPDEYVNPQLTEGDTLGATDKPTKVSAEVLQANQQQGEAQKKTQAQLALQRQAKAYDELVNLAEKQAREVDLTNYVLLTDDELVAWYVREGRLYAGV